MISEKLYIPSTEHRLKLIVLSPEDRKGRLPGILWIHGGGYMLGMAAMVNWSCGKSLAEKYGAVVVSPEYRLAWREPYPAALEDCYDALEYMWDHADELGIDRDRIMVGGESAGGGLAAATCIYARDQGKVHVAMQMPLYPMLDCQDTPSSRNNHGKVWNTKRNHWGWRHYLGELYGAQNVPSYASPSRETNYAELPPCYTYVCEGEPFYWETMRYVENLKAAGVDAKVDVFPGNVHAFDGFRFWTREAKEAYRQRNAAFEDMFLNNMK